MREKNSTNEKRRKQFTILPPFHSLWAPFQILYNNLIFSIFSNSHFWVLFSASAYPRLPKKWFDISWKSINLTRNIKTILILLTPSLLPPHQIVSPRLLQNDHLESSKESEKARKTHISPQDTITASVYLLHFSIIINYHSYRAILTFFSLSPSPSGPKFQVADSDFLFFTPNRVQFLPNFIMSCYRKFTDFKSYFLDQKMG